MKREERKTAKYTMAVAVILTGVEAHQIRRYEACGLLEPLRTGAGQRLFSDNDIEAIKETARLGAKGINLEGIKAIIRLRKGHKL